MGNSSYDFVARAATTTRYASKRTDEIFTQTHERRVHESMNPYGVKIRESRDSENHPNSVPVIMGLDVTGSMGRIPEKLIREDLPKLVSNVMERGIADPQILFIAIGDQYSDKAPIQVGQFESGDKEMDLWLSRTWLEGNGGGDKHESYLLAWYFAAMHTVHDNFEKRGRKGFLFTIGDEKCHPKLEHRTINRFIGAPEAKEYSMAELLELAKKTYNVYHLNVIKGSYGTWPESQWREILGNNLISIHDYREIPNIIANIVATNAEKTLQSTVTVSSKKEENITTDITQPVTLL